MYFIHFFNSTISLISEDEAYKTADAKGKLLTFYFTFFEQLSQNRSLVLYVLGNGTSLPIVLKAMEPLKSIFKDYIKTLGISVIDTSIEKIEKYKE